MAKQLHYPRGVLQVIYGTPMLQHQALVLAQLLQLYTVLPEPTQMVAATV